MNEMMITSGDNFDGYCIKEYLGFVSAQTALGSNIFKGIASGLTDLSEEESENLTSKLENANDLAIEKIQKIAKRMKADAIIGMQLNYTQFANNSFGTIGTGLVMRSIA